ncbi:winged helix-turn-helix domain-containing protein [Natronorubrum bangense]|uniref:Hth domain-containing protein n=2 Tax=Natronorubrum bangense TaxID=61858 RepID=L9WJX4_9EURY|nr:winged helix-turn-helix domain-containing protein [Natronorubrum bangense]ELY49759.1 hth domain-containing protein [Natronorubrum bangense JCM 10635]QCC55387.1 ArsR family transcriptional regulator [Natronorubrum bangense]
MGEDCDVETIGGVLEDSVARSILVHARTESLSANALADRCDVSTVTIYRRLETLREHDLVVASTVPERDGNHYKVYRTNVRRLTVDLTDDGFELSIERTDTAADRFTRLIEEM